MEWEIHYVHSSAYNWEEGIKQDVHQEAWILVGILEFFHRDRMSLSSLAVP